MSLGRNWCLSPNVPRRPSGCAHVLGVQGTLVAAGVLVVVVPLAILIMRGREIGDLVDEERAREAAGFADGCRAGGVCGFGDDGLAGGQSKGL